MINLDSFKKKELLNWNSLFLFFIFLLLLPDHLIELPPIGVDSSWQIALNLAARDGLVFGKDFIFTYGPLGFLSTHLGLGIPYGNLWIFIFDLSIVGAILFLINRILREYNSLLVYGVIFIAVYHLSFAGTIYRILVVIIFFLFQNIKKFSFYSMTLVVLLLVILFFIKPNVSIYFIVIFFVTTLYVSVIKGQHWAWVYPLGLLLLIWVLSNLLKVNLTGYLTSTLELVRSYSESMNGIALSKLKAILSLLFALTFVGTFLIILLLTNLKSKNLDTILFSGILILSLYFLFKQSYVRFDSGHLISFWSTVMSIALIFFYHTSHLTGRLIKYLYILILIILISSFSYFSKFSGGKYLIPLPVSYLNEFFYPNFKNDYIKSASKLKKLPESIRTIVGNNSVDVLPDDINSIYFNGLNYKPRPVIQSYVAVSTALNAYNCNFFKRNDASEFILFSTGSIDNRYPFWDESLTKQVLLTRYETLDSLFVWNEKNDTSFLLKKRINPLICNERFLNDTLLDLNRKYYLPTTSNLIYLSAEIEYSRIGKLYTVLYQPPLIFIKLFYEDGGTGIYRLVLPEMRHGVVINKRILTQSDAYLFFKYQGQRNENITSFVILSDSKAYKSRFRIRLSEYSIAK
jgi:hypothetical protein